MPEISDSEFRQYAKYQTMGTPEEVWQKRQDLERDNRDQREELRLAKETQPKEGQVIVSKADSELLPKYKELGKPEDIKGNLTAGQEASGKLVLAERRTSASAFAKVAGLAAEAVDTLVAIPDLATAVFEVKKGKVKNAAGQEVEADLPYITVAGEGDSKETLLFTDALEKFPALKGLRMAAPGENKPPATVVPFTPQVPGDHTAPPDDLYAGIRADAAARQKARTEQPKGAVPLEERMGMTHSA